VRAAGEPHPHALPFPVLPKSVLTDGQNQVVGLEVEDTKLELKGADPTAVGLKTYYTIPCDSVVFAVGDRVDEAVGLPYKNGVFVTNPNRTQNDPDDSLFQAYDEAAGAIIPGVFLCGWARKASEGLVGVAKRTGSGAAKSSCGTWRTKRLSLRRRSRTS